MAWKRSGVQFPLAPQTVSLGARWDCSGPIKAGTVTPETFKLIEVALVRAEHMHDERAVIQQHPLPLLFAFDTYWRGSTRRSDLLLDRIDNSIDLPGVSGAGDHKMELSSRLPQRIECYR